MQDLRPWYFLAGWIVRLPTLCPRLVRKQVWVDWVRQVPCWLKVPGNGCNVSGGPLLYLSLSAYGFHWSYGVAGCCFDFSWHFRVCSAATPCPLGQYSIPGQATCTPCPGDFYASTTGTAFSCTKCPAGTTTNGKTGATSVSACSKPPGRVHFFLK